MLFVQHLFSDEEHLIFGMMNAFELHSVLKEHISHQNSLDSS